MLASTTVNGLAAEADFLADCAWTEVEGTAPKTTALTKANRTKANRTKWVGLTDSCDAPVWANGGGGERAKKLSQREAGRERYRSFDTTRSNRYATLEPSAGGFGT